MGDGDEDGEAYQGDEHALGGIVGDEAFAEGLASL